MSKPINFSLHANEFEEYLLDVIERDVAGHKGIQYIYKFRNGYGASVVKMYGSYGYENDNWELAVILFETEDDILKFSDYMVVKPYEICRGEPILGNLRDRDVRRIFKKIQEL